MASAALSYQEPDITDILVLSSFLLLLNLINHVLDRLVYCGLIGQILVGIAWGTPAADWLSQGLQHAVVKLGYLGLILLVYEGGLQTNLHSLKANLILSALVAAIGISCPIALSFVLTRLLNISNLQAFAAGAALCSTSLGTTFTVLSTSGLNESRLGVVLSSAAMMDDVVGLIMVKVVSNLGQATDSIDPVTVLRPVLVSVAFAVVLPLLCLWIVKPLSLFWSRRVKTALPTRLVDLGSKPETNLLFHTAVLLAMVTAASYAGTSNLFAAYLAGLSITWWSNLSDSRSQAEERSQPVSASLEQKTCQPGSATAAAPSGSVRSTPGNIGSDGRHQSQDEIAMTISPSIDATKPEGDAHDSAQTPAPNTGADNISGRAIYARYYAPAVDSILKPFFFASIGFSIPVTQMFTGAIVWRGFVYAALMALGKLLCGLCLVRFTVPSLPVRVSWKPLRGGITTCWAWSRRRSRRDTGTARAQSRDNGRQSGAVAPPSATQRRVNRSSPQQSTPAKSRSLYPAAMLGSAMVARGEIGFLISSVAESTGIYGQTSDGASSELFLVVTWAILVCTIIGPLVVGLLAKRVKRLQVGERNRKTGREDPLGRWGVLPET